jgi:hypothetical protein
LFGKSITGIDAADFFIDAVFNDPIIPEKSQFTYNVLYAVELANAFNDHTVFGMDLLLH